MASVATGGRGGRDGRRHAREGDKLRERERATRCEEREWALRIGVLCVAEGERGEDE